ncbi:MAG: hypothetical protein R3F60_27465 [bacterium]
MQKKILGPKRKPADLAEADSRPGAPSPSAEAAEGPPRRNTDSGPEAGKGTRPSTDRAGEQESADFMMTDREEGTPGSC